MKTISKTGLKVKAAIKAGGFAPQHNRRGLRVRANIKAGGFAPQHNRRGLTVKAGIRGGYNYMRNHSGRPLVA
jgi:hypothetical protein